MEILIMATIAMGVIAKFLEFELGRNVSEEDFVDIEKIQAQQYSLKNVETF